jgi:hypothetical protein
MAGLSLEAQLKKVWKTARDGKLASGKAQFEAAWALGNVSHSSL